MTTVLRGNNVNVSGSSVITESAPMRLSRVSAISLWLTGCLLWALAILLPFQVGTWPGFYKQMLAVMGLVCWQLAVRPKQWHAFSLCMMLLIAVVGVQYASGLINFRDDAFVAIAYLFMLSLAFEIGAALRSGNKESGKEIGVEPLDIFLWVVVFVALLSALVAVHQWLGNVHPTFEFPRIDGRSYANLAQPNHLAAVLMLGYCATLFLYQHGKLASYLSVVVAGIFLLSMALTVSRVGWLFVVIACAYLAVRRWRREIYISPWVLSGLFVFFVAAVFATEWLSQHMDLAQTGLSERVSPDSMNRLRLWQGLLTAVSEGPWYGYGWMQVATAELASSFPRYGEYINFAHDLPIDLLVWMGPWLGGLCILAAASWLVSQFCRASQTDEYILWLALGSMVAYALLEFPFSVSYFLISFGLLLGWVTRGGKVICANNRYQLHRITPWLIAALLSIAIALVMRDYELLLKGEFHDQMRAAHVEGFSEVDLDQVVLLDSLANWQQVKRVSMDTLLDDTQLQRLERVTSRLPAWSNLYRLEKNYLARKDREGVCRTLDAIHKVHNHVAMRGADEMAKELVEYKSCATRLLSLGTDLHKRYPVIF